MTSLNLAPDLQAPLDAVTRTFGVVGQRGTGKSTAACVLVEEIVGAGARAVIADPTGVWWGLGSSADGKGPGVPAIVLGGEHGDAPLEETGGHLVAELVTGADYSVVVLDLKLMRKAQQVRFMADFVEALYHANREPLHVVFDEAGRFAPQQLREAGNAPRLLGAIEDTVKLGRSRGLGCTLIEQRPATINKNVLEQVETLVAFRLIGPRDRKAIHDWVVAQGDPEREREVMDTIAKLGRGEAWVWSPSFLDFLGRVTFRGPWTFDSRRTPEVGVTVDAPVERAPVDLEGLRAQMAETIERAAESDPKELRRRLEEARGREDRMGAERDAALDRIMQLERQVAALETAGQTEVHHWTPIISDEVLERLEGAVRDLQQGIIAARETGRNVSAALHPPAPDPARMPSGAPEIVRTPAQPAPRAKSEGEGDATLRRGERALLAALAAYPEPLTPARWGALAEIYGNQGYSPRSSTYRAYRGTLKREGLIHENGSGTVAITAAGEDRVTADGMVIAPLRTGAQLREAWMGLLRRGEREMLTVLLRAHPAPLSRDELGEQSGFSPSSSTYRAYLGTLRRLELAEVTPGEVRAADFLVDGIRG